MGSLTTATSQDLATQPQPFSIPHLLRRQALLAPDAPALLAPARSPLTFRQLLAHMEQVAEELNRLGIGRNERVALVIPDAPEMAVAFLCVASAAACAPLNPGYRANEFEFYLRDLGVKALIIQTGADSEARSVAEKLLIPIIELLPADGAAAGLYSLRGEPFGTVSHSGLAEAEDLALLLHTSGTTSRPKLVPLTHKNLLVSAHNMASALALQTSDRALNPMPLFHIHGLMVVLSSIFAGGSAVNPERSGLADLVRGLAEFRPTWISASPTIHRVILGQAAWDRDAVARCPLRFIRSSSSPLPVQLMGHLETTFNAPVIEAYAMTEAAHQITSNPLPPGKRKPGSVGKPAGPEVAIVDREGSFLPEGSVGEIVIRGANVMRGYENNPAANAASFVDGWFRTGDEGFLDSEGYLFITGRLKEIINRGGEKISPREVDEALMAHPAVVDVASFAVPHPALGEDVAAAVVLRKNVPVTEPEILESAALRLAEFKVPRRIFIVDRIPRTATGKVQRVGLAERFGIAEIERGKDDGRAAPIPPRTPAESMLAAMWARLLHLERVGIKDNFFDLGGHSLLAAHLVTLVKRQFGKDLRIASVYQAPTIEKLAELITDERPAPPWSSLVPLQPCGSRIPFFWVHGEASDAFLPKYLGLDQPVYGLRHQGEDGKPARYRTIKEIARHYLEEMRTVQSSGPFLLGGFCFGGIVAFEIAQQLREQGQETALLVLLNPAFPSASTASSSQSGVRQRYAIYRKLGRHLRQLRALERSARWPYVSERLEAIGRNIMSRIKKKYQWASWRICITLGVRLPVRLRSPYILDVYAQAKRCYTPQFYPGRVLVLKGIRYSCDLPGWRKVAGSLEVDDVPGDHLSVLQEPDIEFWAGKLRRHLEKVQSTIARRE
jgi:acyl-CoA synthetase (AMP-forming)/AMP-acid ligase II/thioesterase domain-containing protein/acyl carrier protein